VRDVVFYNEEALGIAFYIELLSQCPIAVEGPSKLDTSQGAWPSYKVVYKVNRSAWPAYGQTILQTT
jgi:hypothetical protein